MNSPAYQDEEVPLRSFEIGVVLPLMQFGPDRATARWSVIREMAVRAESIGFDTIWTPDELLWRMEEGPPRGVWEGVAMSGAVAAVTSRAKVGTWVMSALHRNAGIIAKAAETLDEISGGRFVFGLGAGHEWPGQAHAFGLPEDQIFARFDEALQIIIPLLRSGHVDFEGTWHAARDLPQQPVGPRPNRIPILIGGNGPKGQRHAVRHADIYSCYVEERAHIDEVRPRLASLDVICAEVGRDPSTLGRSIGVVVNPLEPAGQRASALSGSAEEIADSFRSFRDGGFTQLEVMLGPGTIEALEALAPVLELLDAD
ncbi:MAG TPA: LLM class flavin-dependent oxidoreductase [Candidatus Limnocylindrales bacterium]|nr:LLM class flavin-dependent oxidoreductase [Candidatus Limnocylindrales bacterium]